ncbi:UNVERIFIED_CONTAM: hypothetical protein FKN15_023377 [Acipenser sinensis]
MCIVSGENLGHPEYCEGIPRFQRSLSATNSALQIQLKDTEKNYSDLQKNHKRVTESCNNVQRSLSANNSALQIQLKDTEKNYSDLQKNHKRVTESCNNVQRSLSANNSVLENKLKDMENNYCAFQKNPTRLTESCIPVWKWIRSAAVDVTLDPNTAHPSLILSEEGKHVRLGNTRQALPDNPERFDPVVNVLGRQGFTSGRHYWQVEVGEKTAWDLGVARESINRKGKITANPKYGLWIVWLRDGEYKALADPSIPLPLSVKLRKLGVYLDYEEGQLSFYNVETRSHIYTFNDTFTEKLYPFFNTGVLKDGKNAAPLIIRPVSDRD